MIQETRDKVRQNTVPLEQAEMERFNAQLQHAKATFDNEIAQKLADIQAKYKLDDGPLPEQPTKWWCGLNEIKVMNYLCEDTRRSS